MGKIAFCPVVGVEEFYQSAIAAGGQEGDHFCGGENILLFYFECVFVDVVIHAIPVLPFGQVGKFLKEVHEGSCYPEAVAGGNDKIVDVGVFVGKMFGERAGYANAADVREAVEPAGDAAGYFEEFVGVVVAAFSPGGQGRVVPETVEFAVPEEQSFVDKFFELCCQVGRSNLFIEKEEYFGRGDRVAEEVEIS